MQRLILTLKSVAVPEHLPHNQYSVTAAINRNGTVDERYAYSPYGETTVLNSGYVQKNNNLSTIDNEYTYTGRRLDPSGLMYFRARYYDPGLGQFISRDPLGYVDGMSLYRGYFAPGGVDPWGLQEQGNGVSTFALPNGLGTIKFELTEYETKGFNYKFSDVNGATSFQELKEPRKTLTKAELASTKPLGFQVPVSAVSMKASINLPTANCYYWSQYRKNEDRFIYGSGDQEKNLLVNRDASKWGGDQIFTPHPYFKNVSRANRFENNDRTAVLNDYPGVYLNLGRNLEGATISGDNDKTPGGQRQLHIDYWQEKLDSLQPIVKGRKHKYSSCTHFQTYLVHTNGNPIGYVEWSRCIEWSLVNGKAVHKTVLGSPKWVSGTDKSVYGK